ncbi:U3 small nucleolar RNA-associated protein 25 [Myxozyma melibiosi]|uniref:U3 small nucleolar RNA-associated protein 25 n=1 Tax=Myxozyma melibiosi TaxID=54550 RepID=A0ABR1F7H0_9ASCO
MAKAEHKKFVKRRSVHEVAAAVKTKRAGTKKIKVEHDASKVKHEETTQVKAESEDDDEEEEEEHLDDDDDDSASDISEDESGSTDPFHRHFSHPHQQTLKKLIGRVQAKGWVSEKIKPVVDGEPAKYSINFMTLGGAKMLDEINVADATLESLNTKGRLVEPFKAANKGFVQEKNKTFSPVQEAVASRILANEDVLFAPRTISSGQQLQNLYTLHMLNHIFKTRDTVLKNNAKLAKRADADDSLELRDQGFTRPKALVILPTREACYKLVSTILKLTAPSQPENFRRFQQEYHSDATIPDTKPEDFRRLFSGNNDDNFRIGIKFTRKTVKMYSEFYNSDIIIASPLGLRLAIGDKTDKKRDFDFLSSIEILILDQTAAIAMQNWEHILHIFAHLNLIPQDSHGCDFSRIRNWYLDGEAKYLRQTLIFSEFITPEINALFTHHMNNVGGKAKYLPVYNGVLGDIGTPMNHTFMKFYSSSPQEDPDKRFKYFTTKALPSLMRQSSASSAGTIIFVPSYVDFVRLRNYFEQEHQIGRKLGSSGFEFSAVNEYTSTSDLTRARALFKDGKHKVLLYTERLHHFRRYVIRGAESVFMYSLPDNPTFYVEISRFLLRSVSDGIAEQDAIVVRSLFSKWDAFKLERIVGSAKFAKMCAGAGEIFEFS